MGRRLDSTRFLAQRRRRAENRRNKEESLRIAQMQAKDFLWFLSTFVSAPPRLCAREAHLKVRLMV